MKNLLTTVAFIFLISSSYAQSADSEKTSNSFEDLVDSNIHYTYDESTQTHNYSGNWDLDGDGISDSLFFIGNGGAHLYYHLKVVLSKDKKPQDFEFLMLDMPVLSNITELKKSSLLFPSFVVSDFDADGLYDVYLNFDVTFSSIPGKWKKLGLSSRRVLVQYKNRSLIIKDFAH